MLRRYFNPHISIKKTLYSFAREVPKNLKKGIKNRESAVTQGGSLGGTRIRIILWCILDLPTFQLSIEYGSKCKLTLTLYSALYICTF